MMLVGCCDKRDLGASHAKNMALKNEHNFKSKSFRRFITTKIICQIQWHHVDEKCRKHVYRKKTNLDSSVCHLKNAGEA